MNNQNDQNNSNNELFNFYNQVFSSFSDFTTKSRVPKSQSEIEGLRVKIESPEYMKESIRKTADIIVKSEGKKWN